MIVITVTRAVLAALLCVVTASQAIPRQMTIAAVFDEGGDPKHELAFHHAVQSINRNRWQSDWDGMLIRISHS